ncbi:RNA-binding domain-containing protein [Ascobolus immersus RN42]|uniref:RNA-binding domain-containing protein n=1 Tax=Ascobolus immersus RN42 TaxID=1160509 RepID=A0A3N4I061_ASCIM|nr:RNA-binding domain-containing protein [Ascobolus immersus RN42]
MSYPYAFAGTPQSYQAPAAFRPRQVTGPQPPSVGPSYPPTGAPQTTYGSTPTYYPGSGARPEPTTYGAPPASYSSVPHIVNPFPNPNKPQDPKFAPLDPELQAQIAMQQSIYDTGPSGSASTATRDAAKRALLPADVEKAKTVVRSGGGQTWVDNSLLEWDPSHFRLFVGNLAGEVTDESLLKAFSKYPSVRKARVIRDKRTTKSKGYGFVSFEDGDEYFRAAKEMNGKYIGSHPVQLKKSTTEIKPVVLQKGGGRGRGGVDKKKVDKKKKKGGPKLLG